MELAKPGTPKYVTEKETVDPSELARPKAMVQGGGLDAAKMHAHALLEDHPKSAQLYNILAIIALSSDDPKSAQLHFEKSLTFAPGFAGAAASLGVIFLQRKNFDQAIDVLIDAVRLDPDALQARTNLANAYLNANRHQEAFDQSSELLQRAPGHEAFLKIRATAALKLGQLDSVHDALDQIEGASGISNWSARQRF